MVREIMAGHLAVRVYETREQMGQAAAKEVASRIAVAIRNTEKRACCLQPPHHRTTSWRR